MLLVPRYNGVELPIYEPDSNVLYRKDEFIEAAQSGQANFLRALRVERPFGIRNLNRIQTTAKHEFDRLADFCDAEVVPHSWGLYEVPPEEFVPARKYLNPRGVSMPKGYILVAEVAVIEGIKVKYDPLHSLLWHGINRYFSARGKHKLCDQFPGQFIGNNGGALREPVIHVDVEPRFSR